MTGQLARRPRARGRLRRSPLGKWEIIGEIAQIVAPYVADGLSSFFEAAACDIVGAQESFFRDIGALALAHRAAQSRAVAGCYAGPRPSLVPRDPPLTFDGGLCPGTNYRFSGTQLHSNGTTASLSMTAHGPIQSFRVEETAFGREAYYLRGFTSDGSPRVVEGPSAPAGATISGLTPNVSPFPQALSGVDNCGALPPNSPGYPGGSEPRPVPVPGVPFTAPRIVVVPHVVGGVTVNFGFSVGSVSLGVTGNASFDFGGIDVNVSPDLAIDIGDDGSPGGGFGEEPIDIPDFPEIPDYSGDFEGLGDALDSIGNKQDALDNALDSVGQGVGELVDRVQEVKDLMSIDFDDTLQWVSCRGVEDAVGYEGIGLRGLESALKALLALVNLGSNEYCEILPPPPLAGTVTLSEFFPAQEIDNFFDVTPESGTKAISLEIELSRPSYSVRRGSNGGDGDLQGRYGVVSFLEEIAPGDWQTVTEPVNQYYSVGLYRVPKTGNSVRIRVSVSAGSACTYRELV